MLYKNINTLVSIKENPRSLIDKYTNIKYIRYLYNIMYTYLHQAENNLIDFSL